MRVFDHLLSPDAPSGVVGLAVEANAAGRLRLLEGAEGVELHDDPDRLWTISPLSHPMLNHVSLPRFPADDIEANVDAALAPYRVIGQRSYWWLGPATEPASLGSMLPRHGLAHTHSLLGLAMPLRHVHATRPAPEGLQIQRVSDASALERWLSLFCAEDPPEVVEFFRRYYLGQGFAEDGPLQNYLATLDGTPVGCVTLILAAGVAGIGGLAVAEHARGQGIGAGVAVAALLEGRSRGYHWGVLQSAREAPSLYHNLGFRECCRIEAFAG